MSELFTSPLFRLTFLFTVALIVVITMRKLDPSWKVAMIRGAFIGGLCLFLTPLSGIQWELPSWVVSASLQQGTNTPTVEVGTADFPAPGKALESLTEPELQEISAPPSPAFILFALWFLVALALLIQLGRVMWHEHKSLSDHHSPSSELAQLWSEVCHEIGTHSHGVRIIDEKISPRLSPGGALVLPASFINGEFGKTAQRHILRHEAAHLKAGDHFWVPLLALFTALLWFHPLAWWLRSRHLVACEEARDAEAARLGGARAYRSSVAAVALSLIPSTSPSPGLLRKNGRLVARLNRVEETTQQSPPMRAFLVAMQASFVALAILIGSAAPSLAAIASTAEMMGTWRAVDEGERFARQVEVYEWGGEMKLRIWYAVGNDNSLRGATVVSLDLSREELDQELASDGSISVNHANSFSTSVYTLEVRRNELQFQVETTYTDNSGRGTREHTSYYIPGKWDDFASTF